jgi:hypothetical protein
LPTSLTFSGKKSKCECKKWTLSDMQHAISIYVFRSSWTPSLKSGDFFLPGKFEQTYLNLSQAAHSVSVSLSTKASSSRISQIQGPMKTPACSCTVLMLEIFTQVLEPFEFVFATPFTKALPSTQVLCGHKEGISSWD